MSLISLIALIMAAVVVYLWVGVELARWLFKSTAGAELEDWDDYMMFGLMMVVGPVVSPFVLTLYGLGRLGARLIGMSRKDKDEDG